MFWPWCSRQPIISDMCRIQIDSTDPDLTTRLSAAIAAAGHMVVTTDAWLTLWDLDRGPSSPRGAGYRIAYMRTVQPALVARARAAGVERVLLLEEQLLFELPALLASAPSGPDVAFTDLPDLPA